jgi:glycosyltransferase involved in cell wall biosynthesis
MRQLAECAHQTRRNMKLVTSLPAAEALQLPVNTINLPCIYHVTPEFYTAFTLRIPSLLRAIDIIADELPDEIVISTPGPVGLVGYACARMLGIRCIGIYHTDFARQADFFIGDAWVSQIIESYTRGFFRLMDEVRVPTQQYIDLLSDRGLDPAKMKIFRRGIDRDFFVDDKAMQQRLRAENRIPDGITLLYAGRLGKEKNLDFLLDLYRRVAEQRDAVNLLLVGDGPELEDLRRRTADNPRIMLPGRVERGTLAHYYALADLFVFPSLTDTFGMVVLEAQACGLPAVVTDQGGPQEIVFDGHTGRVLPHDRPELWDAALIEYIDRRRNDPDGYAALRAEIHELFRTSYGWENVLDEMLGIPQDTEPPPDVAADAPPASPARPVPALGKTEGRG